MSDCRFEAEYEGKSYPRTCPVCGLSGACQKGYLQVKLNAGGYVILNSRGVPRTGDNKDWAKNGVPAEVLIAQGKLSQRTTMREEPKSFLNNVGRDKRGLKRVQLAKMLDLLEEQFGVKDENMLNGIINEILNILEDD